MRKILAVLVSASLIFSEASLTVCAQENGGVDAELSAETAPNGEVIDSDETASDEEVIDPNETETEAGEAASSAEDETEYSDDKETVDETADDTTEESAEEVEEESASEESSDKTEVEDSDAEPTASESDSDIDDDEEDESDEETPAFSQRRVVNGVEVSVYADEGVFPEGAILTVRRASSFEDGEIDTIIDGVRDGGKTVASAYTFEITILSADGTELEPDTSKGSVRVSFSLAEAANSNLSTEVYHIDDALNAEQLPASTDGTLITAETDGFSYYTVEFTYGTLQYVMEGDSEVALADIVSSVGLSGGIVTASGSNDGLFSVYQDGGEWRLRSQQAFSTEEQLYVTLEDGVTYEITVTDAQTVTLANNGYPYGTEMSTSGFKLIIATESEGDYSYKWQSSQIRRNGRI